MFKNCLILAIVLLLQGCSSVLTVTNGDKIRCDPDSTITRIYSGTSNDIRFLAGNYQDKGVAFFDLPFSLAADTIFLPYTVVTQAAYGNLCDKNTK
jgi:uncharacterized protein YceK